MIRFKIKKYHHGFKVRATAYNDRALIKGYYDQLAVFDSHYDRKQKRRIQTRKETFATYTPRIGEYGLLNSEFKPFMEHLERANVNPNHIEIRLMTTDIGEEIQVDLQNTVKPKDYQPPLIEHLLSTGHTRVLPLQTGKGKTFCALYALTQRSRRTAITLAPRDVETWKKDMDWMYEGGSECARVIKGGIAFRKLIADARNGKDIAPVLIFTLNTMRDYLTEFEKSGESSYGCNPEDLYGLLGVGLRITDEAHENLHFHVRAAIEMPVEKAIYLSATLESYDAFKNRIYESIYPHTDRHHVPWDCYIDVVALYYNLKTPDKAKYKGYGGRYNHIEYEKWIMRDPERLKSYFNIIFKIVKRYFLDEYQDKQKHIVFFSSKEMCESAAVFISERTERSCHAYTGDHDSKVLHTHDIICTTPGSAGTGKDVKGLVSVTMTPAILARESNIQILGRLRDIVDMFPGMSPKFVYIVCRDIDKHLTYNESRKKLYRQFAKQVSEFNTGLRI